MPIDDQPEPRSDSRDTTRARHTAALGSLMSERSDLRGVYAVADFFDDAVRWSA